MPGPQKTFSNPVTRLLPYTFLCTIGPSVTAATALFIVRTLMCRYDQQRSGKESPSPGDAVCNSPTVGALTASIMAALATLDGIVSFLSSSYVQNLADKHGRRPLLIVLPLLATLATSAMIVAYIVPNTRLAWILLVLNGVFVSASTKSVFVPTLCVADVANDKQRTRFYSLLEAVSLLGPGFAYIISALSSRYIPIVLFPYYIALGAQFISSLYAIIFVPETLKRSSKHDEEESEDEDSDAESEGVIDQVVESVVEAVVEPVKPLALLLPHRGKHGSLEWRLFILTMSLLATTSGTVFIATASLLFLSDKFQFNPEANAWVLAFLTFSRFAYLLLLFPLVQRFGRIAYNRYAARKIKNNGERAPLLSSNSFKAKKENEEANHFDVILLFVSVCFDAFALMLVSTSTTWKHALVGFGILAFGSGDNPTFKSVFVSSVPTEHASQALAALDMVFNAARLLSPLLLGSIYAIFAERGHPELLFLVAGGLCAVGAALLAPLVFLGRKATRL